MPRGRVPFAAVRTRLLGRRRLSNIIEFRMTFGQEITEIVQRFDVFAQRLDGDQQR